MSSGALIQRGNRPIVHTIRYSGKGNIRSYDFTARNVDSNIDNNLFEYSSALTEVQWLRFISAVNLFLDFNFVELVDNKLVFRMNETTEFTEEECRFVYMLFGEIFLTKNKNQILLLSDIEFMTKEHQIKLISFLTNILRVEFLVSAMNIDYSDINKTNNIPVVNT